MGREKRPPKIPTTQQFGSISRHTSHASILHGSHNPRSYLRPLYHPRQLGQRNLRVATSPQHRPRRVQSDHSPTPTHLTSRCPSHQPIQHYQLPTTPSTTSATLPEIRRLPSDRPRLDLPYLYLLLATNLSRTFEQLVQHPRYHQPSGFLLNATNRRPLQNREAPRHDCVRGSPPCLCLRSFTIGAPPDRKSVV